MNKELSRELAKRAKHKFPDLNLTPTIMCQITSVTLGGVSLFLRKQTTFNSARLFKYASEAVGDFLKEG